MPRTNQHPATRTPKKKIGHWETGQPRQGKGYRPLREINKLRIPFVPFVRHVKELTNFICPEIERWTPPALFAIQEAAEYHLVDLLATPQGKKILHLLFSPGSSSSIIFHLLSSPGSSSSSNSISGATTRSSSESNACILSPSSACSSTNPKPKPNPNQGEATSVKRRGQEGA